MKCGLLSTTNSKEFGYGLLFVEEQCKSLHIILETEMTRVFLLCMKKFLQTMQLAEAEVINGILTEKFQSTGIYYAQKEAEKQAK